MPINRDDFFFMLGLAMRSGNLTLGESGVHKAISSGTAKLVLVDEAASENTKKKYRDSCTFYNVQLLLTSADRLGQSIGKPGRMSAAVAAGPLCERLMQLAQQE